MNKFSRWVRSKQGLAIIAVIVILALVVVVVGQQSGWWGGGGLTGTVGLPSVDYPAPVNGYTCLPTCDETDGKFLIAQSQGNLSFADYKTVVWIAVPGNYSNFTLGIFDGDSGKDNNGGDISWEGNWDEGASETTYKLFADPLKDGSGSQALGEWLSNQAAMPNNAWYELTVDNAPAAQAPSGHFFYRLEITHPIDPVSVNAFKLRSNAYLSTGKSGLAGSSFGVIGMLTTYQDLLTIYPEFQGDFNNLGPSTYNGDWQFYFYVPTNEATIEIWDGDFDRGTASTVANDTDDPNTTGKPEWASVGALPERAGGKGAPADDYSHPLYRRSPAVFYEIIDPMGTPIYTNQEPSGTEEWERFVMSTDPNVDADLSVTEIKPGLYNLHVQGLDLHNSLYLRLDYDICDPEDGCGPCIWPGECDPEPACPRTIGYWKNNVKKVLIDGKTKGVQETPETLDWALQNVAKSSRIFRTGANVQAPTEFGLPGSAVDRLTNEEANMILQRDQKTYPGGKDQANSMLARALQQNLAAWLNLGSGKVGEYTVVTLNVAGGTFEGTILQALREAEDIILNGGDLERAKDIGDQINNGNLGEDADVIECSVDKIPPEKQPCKPKDCPKAPTSEPPPPVVPPPQTCTVENSNLGGGYAIIALNPADCQGQQNGLLFHGTSSTTLEGKAFSNGCLRSVGTHSVESAGVEYVFDSFGDMSLINPTPVQVPDPVSVQVDPPNCDDPAAHHMDGKDFKQDVLLEPGLWCITGDVTINAGDRVRGDGVTLYFVDGGLHINGKALVQLSAPMSTEENPSPALPNILFYVPGANGDGQPVQINGTSDSYFAGVVYAPGSEIEVLGTGYVVGMQAQFIGWDVRVGGTADIILGYQGSELPVCVP